MRNYPDEQMRADMHERPGPRVLTASEMCVVALTYTGCVCVILYVSLTLVGTYHEAIAAALPPIFGLSIAAGGWRRKR